MTAAIIIPNGQAATAWFILFALLAIWVLYQVSKWTIKHKKATANMTTNMLQVKLHGRALYRALGLIAILMLAKFTYIVSLSNYYTFYLIEKFDLSLKTAQFCLFGFLAAVALGTFIGGPIGDKIGRKAVIIISFLGMAPFALILPYVDLTWTLILSVVVGLVMSSAFSAMVVYAQEAVPGRVGMIAGLMFGLMFGISGIAAAALGYLADHQGIEWVFIFCSFLPLLGIGSLFLPNIKK